jgi:hypothetical protein
MVMAVKEGAARGKKAYSKVKIKMRRDLLDTRVEWSFSAGINLWLAHGRQSSSKAIIVQPQTYASIRSPCHPPIDAYTRIEEIHMCEDPNIQLHLHAVAVGI